MKFNLSSFNRIDIFMALISIIFLIRINMPGRSFVDAIGVLIIIVWFFSSFFKTLNKL